MQTQCATISYILIWYGNWEINRKGRDRRNNLPSIRTPIRRASVPVVGYLSFLASNSAIANDFIAFEDHLLPLTYNNQWLSKRHGKKKYEYAWQRR